MKSVGVPLLPLLPVFRGLLPVFRGSEINKFLQVSEFWAVFAKFTAETKSPGVLRNMQRKKWFRISTGFQNPVPNFVGDLMSVCTVARWEGFFSVCPGFQRFCLFSGLFWWACDELWGSFFDCFGEGEGTNVMNVRQNPSTNYYDTTSNCPTQANMVELTQHHYDTKKSKTAVYRSTEQTFSMATSEGSTRTLPQSKHPAWDVSDRWRSGHTLSHHSILAHRAPAASVSPCSYVLCRGFKFAGNPGAHAETHTHDQCCGVRAP